MERKDKVLGCVLCQVSSVSQHVRRPCACWECDLKALGSSSLQSYSCAFHRKLFVTESLKSSSRLVRFFSCSECRRTKYGQKLSQTCEWCERSLRRKRKELREWHCFLSSPVTSVLLWTTPHVYLWYQKLCTNIEWDWKFVMYSMNASLCFPFVPHRIRDSKAGSQRLSQLKLVCIRTTKLFWCQTKGKDFVTLIQEQSRWSQSSKFFLGLTS